ncbi:MAG: hypothetical protein ACOZIN_22255 [Myxococcota bacterium]
MRLTALAIILVWIGAVVFSGTHTHSFADGETSVCASCQVCHSPSEVLERVELAAPVTVELGSAVVFIEAPRVERCLMRAPKHGPPTA